MLSVNVQQNPRLVELVWLEHSSRLTRLAGFIAHQIHRLLDVVAPNDMIKNSQ